MIKKIENVKKVGRNLNINEMQKVTGGKSTGNALLAGIGTFKSLKKLLKKFR